MTTLLSFASSSNADVALSDAADKHRLRTIDARIRRIIARATTAARLLLLLLLLVVVLSAAAAL